jgi:NADPH:quinone reductase-like Zn-dependent oxidoreductase/surfactin synthase thioesterase subunit/NAD(P)-dependent dehydrogenase (short-subunit alcohol dehydrogenase family)/aryl carrier-like protein
LNCRSRGQNFWDAVLEREGQTEEEIALRGKKRFSVRLERVNPQAIWEAAHEAAPAKGTPFHLEPDGSGVIDNLVFRPKTTPAPGPGEIAIAVDHSALNFRDVMLASGMLPPDALEGGIFGKQLGLECAGEVSAVGHDVRDLKMGDRVMALAADTLSGVALAKAIHAVKIPDTLSTEQAATLPMAYLTAYYGLVTLARVRAGERVLVHAGAGGVGIAAVQIAKVLDADVFATASPAKHAYLRSLGVEGVYDSRDTRFFDDIMADTGGGGMDVVLNSLAGPRITQSLKALASSGRFVEIGKADIYKNKRIGLRLLADNISYFAVDIDRLLLQKPALMGEVLSDAIALFTERGLNPHPYAVYPVAEARAAIEALARGANTGKIVLSMKGTVRVAPPATLDLPRDATYLVAGGTSGFGLETARFLADKGARHIALVSRNGLAGDAEREKVRALEKSDVEVSVFNADIANLEEVRRVVDQCHLETAPLRGVFQSAMVLDDGMLEEMSFEHFSAPLAPKVQGTSNLHQATEKIDLDYFISFSSIASMYGTPGQGNYAAANSFLDQLAAWRRAKGLSATTINWGVLGSVGFVARTEKVRDFLGNHGWAPLSPEEAFQVLERAMLEKPVQIGALKTDWVALGETFPHSTTSYRFAHLHREDVRTDSAGDGGKDLSKLLATTARDKRKGILVSALSKTMGKIVGVAADKVDTELPITRMGLDSLMANQVRSWLTTQTGIDVTLMQIMQGPSIGELAEDIAQKIDQISQGSAFGGGAGWVTIPKPNPDASERLFCFSYLGAGASVFSHFVDAMPEDIELCLVQLPGRENRLAEAPFTDGMALFAELSVAVYPLLDKPYAFYGHSFGGNIAMSFATYLKAVHDTAPAHLFVGAAVPPGVENPLEKRFLENEAKGYDDLSDQDLAELLRTLGAPEAILNDEEVFAATVPALRADLEITRQRLVSKDQKVSCPLTAIAGTGDDIYDASLLAKWEKHSDDFTFERVDGGHLFIHDEVAARAVVELISDALSRADEGEPPADLSERRRAKTAELTAAGA